MSLESHHREHFYIYIYFFIAFAPIVLAVESMGCQHGPYQWLLIRTRVLVNLIGHEGLGWGGASHNGNQISFCTECPMIWVKRFLCLIFFIFFYRGGTLYSSTKFLFVL